MQIERRHDIYKNVHKALRRELAKLLVDAGTVDTTRSANVVVIAARWSEIKRLLSAHHEHEDVHVGPHLRRLMPAIFERMESSHAALERDLLVLTKYAGEAAAELDPELREERMRELYLELASFVGRYFQHMDEEERVHLAVLRAAYTDDELAAIERVLVANIEPSLAGPLLAAMLPAMNTCERADLLAEICAVATPAAFEQTCELAKYVLTTAEWRALRRRLADPGVDELPPTQRSPVTPIMSTVAAAHA